jgi:hypothetical protein
MAMKAAVSMKGTSFPGAALSSAEAASSEASGSSSNLLFIIALTDATSSVTPKLLLIILKF